MGRALGRMIVVAAVMFMVTPLYAEYSVVDLGKDVTPTAVNDQGDVVGFIAATGGPRHAFLYSGGTLKDLGTFNGTSSEANAINNKGQVIGHYTINGERHPFLLHLTQLTDLFTTAAMVKATGINDDGTILGQILYPTTARTEHVVLLREGLVTDISQQGMDQGILNGNASSYGIALNALGEVILDQSLCPGRDCTRHLFYSAGITREMFSLFNSMDLNDKGQVVGSAPSRTNSFLTDGFIYDSGSVTVINAVATYRIDPRSINNLGQVVGDAYGTPFIYSNGTMSDVRQMLPKDTPWAISQLHAINDRGQIIGTGSLEGEPHAFILEPFAQPVQIDIKPNDDTNALKPQQRAPLPVVVFGSPVFDATSIDPASVTLTSAALKTKGKGDRYMYKIKDINGDGFMDYVASVVIDRFAIPPGSLSQLLTLRAVTFTGQQLEGQDAIRFSFK